MNRVQARELTRVMEITIAIREVDAAPQDIARLIAMITTAAEKAEAIILINLHGNTIERWNYAIFSMSNRYRNTDPIMQQKKTNKQNKNKLEQLFARTDLFISNSNAPYKILLQQSITQVDRLIDIYTSTHYYNYAPQKLNLQIPE